MASCEQRVNDTPAKLDACITRAALWDRLAHFQTIADQNPGPNGHGNRDTGMPGYRASVDYVATLMRQAGYAVRIQPYIYTSLEVDGTPDLRTFSRTYASGQDWYVARNSSSGTLTAALGPPRGYGCSPADFSGFTPGNVALIERGPCGIETEVENAEAAGARAAILYAPPGGAAYEARLDEPSSIPVLAVAANAVGVDLLNQVRSGAVSVRIDVRMRSRTGADYNLIADSPFGDPRDTVVIDAHLDSIYGAGMLDNASGSTTILQLALSLAKTPTLNRLRYIWFGGEELGLLGSHYYTKHLPPGELRRIAFDVDADVTATPNFDILIADPARAWNAMRFPKNVLPQSRAGNDMFLDYFSQRGIVSREASFGNGGTDSNSFSLAGVPNTGVLTGQDCCKQHWETSLWGGSLGNYEGRIPSFDGGCVDLPHRWCDNLSNNDPFILELVSKAVARVALELANDPALKR